MKGKCFLKGGASMHPFYRPIKRKPEVPCRGGHPHTAHGWAGAQSSGLSSFTARDTHVDTFGFQLPDKLILKLSWSPEQAAEERSRRQPRCRRSRRAAIYIVKFTSLFIHEITSSCYFAASPTRVEKGGEEERHGRQTPSAPRV